MACIRVWRTGIKRVAWYHFDSYGFLLDFRPLIKEGIVELGWWHGILVRLTFKIPDVPERWTSSKVMSLLTKVRCVAVKVVAQQ